MKSLLAILVLASTLCFSQEAPKQPEHDKALLFTLNGLSNISLGDYAGGFGLKLKDGDSHFWRIMFDFKNVEDKSDAAAGLGYFWQLAPMKTTQGYWGASAFYYTTSKSWYVEPAFGVEWAAWRDISFTGEYCLAFIFPHQGSTSVDIVPSGRLGIVAYF